VLSDGGFNLGSRATAMMKRGRTFLCIELAIMVHKSGVENAFDIKI
jgi:hypothetical protein